MKLKNFHRSNQESNSFMHLLIEWGFFFFVQMAFKSVIRKKTAEKCVSIFRENTPARVCIVYRLFEPCGRYTYGGTDGITRLPKESKCKRSVGLKIPFRWAKQRQFCSTMRHFLGMALKCVHVRCNDFFVSSLPDLFNIRVSRRISRIKKKSWKIFLNSSTRYGVTMFIFIKVEKPMKTFWHLNADIRALSA